MFVLISADAIFITFVVSLHFLAIQMKNGRDGKDQEHLLHRKTIN
jgi:hypothetical protein